MTTETISFGLGGLIFGLYWLLYRKRIATSSYGLRYVGVGIGSWKLLDYLYKLHWASIVFVPNILIGLIGKAALYLDFAEQKTKAYMNHPQIQ